MNDMTPLAACKWSTWMVDDGRREKTPQPDAPTLEQVASALLDRRVVMLEIAGGAAYVVVTIHPRPAIGRYDCDGRHADEAFALADWLADNLPAALRAEWLARRMRGEES